MPQALCILKMVIKRVKLTSIILIHMSGSEGLTAMTDC